MGSGSIGTISLMTQTGEFERKYFISNPDITFFKSVYRKHTNFSKYLLRKTNNVQTGERKQYTIQTGSDDLLSKVYLENKYKFTPSGSDVEWTVYANLGSNIIDDLSEDSLSIDIDSNKGIFKSNGLFQEVKGELDNQMSLTTSGSYTHAPGLEMHNNIISCKNGSHYNYTTLSGGVRGITLNSDGVRAGSSIDTELFYTIPEFSFMKDYGLALPLLSLRNADITFNVKYQEFTRISDAKSDVEVSLVSNFIQELIQLDTAEKSRFLTSQLTYLTENISQTQITGATQNITTTFKLCKYLFLVGAPDTTPESWNGSHSLTTLQPVKFSGLNISLDSNLLYPGEGTVPASIFTKLNINKYFIGCGRDLGSPHSKSLGQSDTIAMVPFSIEPLNFTQPSGCVSILGNSNRISLELRGKGPPLMLFAINYGILQISDGKAQSQYS